MAFPAAIASLVIYRGIAVKDDSCDLLPIGSRFFGIKQTQIGHEMLLIIRGDSIISWSFVSNIGIDWCMHQLPLPFRGGMACGAPPQ